MGAATQVENLDSESFVINSIVFDAPWSWLAAGWRDLSATPVLSLGYGLIFALISMVLAYGLTQFGWQTVVIALAGGFLILGPLFAVGLYEVSRRRADGEIIASDKITFQAPRSPQQLAFMGFILLFLFSAWLRIAFLLFAIFFGSEILPSAERFIPELLFTTHGLGLLIVGTAVGAALAFVAYTISVVSIPLLMEHHVDVFTAMSISVRSVAKNPNPMLLWAVLIAAIMGCGIATGFLGLIVAFPLLGHATWHAYRDLVHQVPAVPEKSVKS